MYQTAGVICFSVEPVTKSIYVLLGKESCFEGDQVTDSITGKWCDFGGRLKNTEIAEEGAAREFAEESLGVIKLEEDSKKTSTYLENVVTMFEKKKYYAKLIIESKHNQKVYFLKQIQWQPNVENHFNNLRYSIMNKDYPKKNREAHPAFGTDSTLNMDYLEKVCIRWWSIDRLTEVIRKRGCYKHEGFRKSFLPALSVILTTLRGMYTN